MADIVRIALNTPGPLKWPQRCPRCGAAGDLLWRDVRVVRNNRGPRNRSMRGPSFLLYTQETIRLPVPMCRVHADTNQAGGRLLDRDVAMIVLRASIHVSLLCLLASAWIALRSGFASFAAFGDVSVGWWAWCLYGVAGLCVLRWARQVAWVRPIRLDPDYDIAVMRFKDEDYARAFKRMNHQATSGAAVGQRPVWLRMTPMKALVLICGLLLLFAIWMGR